MPARSSPRTSKFPPIPFTKQTKVLIIADEQRNRKKIVVVPGSQNGRACHCDDDSRPCNKADAVVWTEKVTAGWNAHTVG